MTKKDKIITGIGVLLLLIALGWAGWNLYDEARAGREAQQIAQQMQQAQLQMPEQAPASPEESEALDPNREMPVMRVDGKDYLGMLEIPELELELPVFSEWDYTKLKQAPCRYQGTTYADNLIIMGHAYKKHFSPLKSLQQGSEIRFTDAEDNLVVYQVDSTEVLEPTAIEQMESGDWDLTLFTCTNNGSARFAVRCSRAED